MSGHNLERTLPPGDRDEAPAFEFDSANAGLDLPPHDDAPTAPTLTEQTTISRLARLSRNMADGGKWVMEAMRLVAEGKHEDARTAFGLADEHLRDAASLSRRLADPRTSRATTKEG